MAAARTGNTHISACTLEKPFQIQKSMFSTTGWRTQEHKMAVAQSRNTYILACTLNRITITNLKHMFSTKGISVVILYEPCPMLSKVGTQDGGWYWHASPHNHVTLLTNRIAHHAFYIVMYVKELGCSVNLVSASWPVREFVVRDLVCPRVDQIPYGERYINND